MSEVILLLPISVPLDFCLIGLLGASNAYLPIQLPDVVVNSLLGALLLMPITMLESARQFVYHMTSSSSSIVQLCGLFVAMAIYLGILAPLFQVVAMKAVGG